MSAAIIIMQGLIAGGSAWFALESWEAGLGVTAAFTVIIGAGLMLLGEKLRRMLDEPER